MGKLRVFCVVGPDPEEPAVRALLGITSEETEAENMLAEGLFRVAAKHASNLKDGGTVSIMLRRGNGSGNERSYAFGSFVMTNPNGTEKHRGHSWDFAVVASDVADGVAI